MSDFVSKYEIEKGFHEWIEGFPANQRFKRALEWNTSFCAQTGKRDVPNVDEHQKDLMRAYREDVNRYRARKMAKEQDKDTRQGVFRR